MRLREKRSELTPVPLLHHICESQSALAAVSSPESGNIPSGDSPEDFLTQMPEMWLQGRLRPTHTRRARGPSHMADPFEGVWREILDWLRQQPVTTAADLLNRLMSRYLGRYSGRQPRTLQRGVRQLRGVIARNLVHPSAEEHNEVEEAMRVNVRPVGVN